MSNQKRRSSGGFSGGYSSSTIELQAVDERDADSVGHDMKQHGSSLRRKKTLACMITMFLLLAAFATMLFVLYAGVDDTKKEVHSLENELEHLKEGKSGGGASVFLGSICGVQSYERYLLVTLNYDAINATDPSSGKPFVSTGKLPPGFLAVIDSDPSSKSYSTIVAQVKLSNEAGEGSLQPRRGTQTGHYYVVGDASPSRSDIYIIDLEKPEKPELKAVLPGDEIRGRYALSAPNTIRSLPDGNLLVAMMGNGGESGGGRGGFLQLNVSGSHISLAQRWDNNNSASDPLNAQRRSNYDFWTQPYVQNTLVSSEWLPAKAQTGAGSAQQDISDISQSSSYLNFWNLKLRSVAFRVDLRGSSQKFRTAPGYMPLEVRMLHKTQALGYVAVAGSGEVIAFWRVQSAWQTQQVIQVDPKLDETQPSSKSGSVPALLTDMIISSDDSRLYLANWAHGEIRQYDISNPLEPLLCATLQVSSGYDKMHGPYESFKNGATGKIIYGGPARLQLRRDGSALFFTTSFVPGWDNDFYPELTQKGSFLGRVAVDTCTCSGSSMQLDSSFGVDFGESKKFPDNNQGLPARAHDIHFLGGDASTYPLQAVPLATA